MEGGRIPREGYQHSGKEGLRIPTKWREGDIEGGYQDKDENTVGERDTQGT